MPPLSPIPAQGCMKRHRGHQKGGSPRQEMVSIPAGILPSARPQDNHRLDLSTMDSRFTGFALLLVANPERQAASFQGTSSDAEITCKVYRHRTYRTENTTPDESPQPAQQPLQQLTTTCTIPFTADYIIIIIIIVMRLAAPHFS